MKSLLLKAGLFLLPLFILIVFYILSDPFKVVRHYDSYYESGKASYVSLNRDYVTFESFKNNYPVYHYDAYIFGSSRSLFYRADDWKNYIHTDKCYHFDGSDESLYGVTKKIKYLDDNNIQIKHCMFILDSDLLEKVKENEGLIFRKHPEFSEKSALSFQLDFLKAFLDYKFLFCFLDLKLTGSYKLYMKKTLSVDTIEYNLKYNETRFTVLDRMIERNEDQFYESRKNIFYDRDSVVRYNPQVIHDK